MALNTFTLLFSHHSPQQKSPLHKTTLPFFPQPLVTSVLPSIPMEFPYSRYLIGVELYNVSVCVWLISPSIMFSRSKCVVAYIKIPFLFLAE